MNRKNQHVVPLASGWAVKSPGTLNVTAITYRKADAICIAKELAKKKRSEMIVHGRNGRIQQRDSYRKKPSRP